MKKKIGELNKEYKKEKLKNAKVGEIVNFGSYEQDNNTSNGKEEIEWQVLEKQDNKILLISRYALDCKLYDSEHEVTTYNYLKPKCVTWENSTLREWLNDDFINDAFSSDERLVIAETKVTAEKNPEYSTDPGNDTTDKIFLLSINEANKYFTTDESRKCVPTDYAIEQGAYISDSFTSDGKATCWWWLRSPGSDESNSAYVAHNGFVNNYGHTVSCSLRGGQLYGYRDADSCIRPSLWVNIDF